MIDYRTVFIDGLMEEDDLGGPCCTWEDNITVFPSTTDLTEIGYKFSDDWLVKGKLIKGVMGDRHIFFVEYIFTLSPWHYIKETGQLHALSVFNSGERTLSNLWMPRVFVIW